MTFVAGRLKHFHTEYFIASRLSLFLFLPFSTQNSRQISGEIRFAHNNLKQPDASDAAAVVEGCYVTQFVLQLDY